MTRLLPLLARPWARARWHLPVCLAATAIALPGCSACDDAGSSASSASAQASAALAPVPAPPGVLADLYVTDPDSTWKAIQKLAGGRVKWLPTTFPMLVGTWLGLPALVATHVSGDVPLVGTVAAGDDGALQIVLGVHVRSGREVVAALTTGNAPTHQASLDAETGVQLLTPAPDGAPTPVALGVVGNILLAALQTADLKRLGPYVARTLPGRKPPAGGVVLVAPASALGSAASKHVRAQWQKYRAELERTDRENREKHGGRAPDFGDPAAALQGLDLGVDRLVEVLASCRSLRVVVQPGVSHLEVRLEIEAEGKGAAAELLSEMQVGDLGPLLSLPRASQLAIATRAAQASRKSSATSTFEGLAKLFGDRLSEDERTRLREVLEALAQGRGDHAAYGLVLGPRGPGVVMRGPVTDLEAFQNGAKGLFRLIELPALAEPVRQFVGDAKVELDSVKIDGLDGNVRRARLTLKPSPVRLVRGDATQINLAPRPIDFLWWMRAGVVYGAAARNATPLLVDVATCAASSDGSLAADEAVSAAAKRAGTEVSFTVVAQPAVVGLAVDPPRSAPVLLTLGRRGTRGWLRVDVHQIALQSLLQRLGDR